MNVVQVSPADVYPPTNGSDHRTHAMLTAFRENGDTVYRFSQVRQRSTLRSFDFQRTVVIDENYFEVRPLNPLYEATRVLTPFLFDHPSLTYLGSALRWWPTSRLKRLLRWSDVVIVRGPWQVPAIADLADVPVVYSVHASPQEPAIEQRALDRAMAAIFESDWSVQKFEAEFDFDGKRIIAPVATYQSNVRDSFTNSETRRRIRREHCVDEGTLLCLFMGTVHEMNVEAAKWTCRMAQDAIERGIDVHFFIVGSVGETLETVPENVTVLGFVEDLEPYFDAVDVGLNPATVDTGGPNIKMLDYFARQLPVVTTERGVRGLDVEHAKDVFLVDRANLLDALVALYEDEPFRRMLGRQGQEYLLNNHTWDAVSAALYEDIEALLEQRKTKAQHPETQLP